mmetsp:Transcript_26627/g.4721  ORF Transcript_26627/g.4721 Transcript_26627/m.4721 type:complete len:104 (-) Transcript_26627:130-441(-)
MLYDSNVAGEYSGTSDITVTPSEILGAVSNFLNSTTPDNAGLMRTNLMISFQVTKAIPENSTLLIASPVDFEFTTDAHMNTTINLNTNSISVANGNKLTIGIK